VTGRATSPSIVRVQGVDTSVGNARWLRTKKRSLARLERLQRPDRRLRVERPGVADEQSELLRNALTARLIRGE
jgi:hypothetical protein